MNRWDVISPPCGPRGLRRPATILCAARSEVKRRREQPSRSPQSEMAQPHRLAGGRRQTLGKAPGGPRGRTYNGRPALDPGARELFVQQMQIYGVSFDMVGKQPI